MASVLTPARGLIQASFTAGCLASTKYVTNNATPASANTIMPAASPIRSQLEERSLFMRP